MLQRIVSRSAVFALCLVLTATAAAQWNHRYAKLGDFNHHIYLEQHDLPAVAHGPSDPAPAPDGWPEEAENWPRKNVITRAIGVSEVPNCDVVSGDIRLGDTFLLCSDGLTEHNSDTDMAGILGRAATAQSACHDLIAQTLDRGAKDNVTAVVVRCMPPEPMF